MSTSEMEDIKVLLLSSSNDKNKQGIELFERLYSTEKDFVELVSLLNDPSKIERITRFEEVVDFFERAGTYASHDWVFMKLVQYGICTNLQVLDLDSSPEKFSLVPFESLNNLVELDCGACELTCVPESITNLSRLQKLIVTENEITSLPNSITKLRSLKYLQAIWNQLTSLPENFGDLTNLEYLELYGNCLTSLPDSLQQLTQLECLSFGENKLTVLPNWIGNLHRLQKFYIPFNDLTCLPDVFHNLASLRKMSIEGTQITSLPDSFNNLVSLDFLNLNGTPFSNSGVDLWDDSYISNAFVIDDQTYCHDMD